MNRLEPPHSRCLVGVARGDITPPVGIYHRMWGAATHDRSTGVHRPLTATVLYLQSVAAADQYQVVVGLDHCLLRPQELQDLRDRVSAAADLPGERFVFYFSHTHAAGLLGYERCDLPGGDLIPPYLERLGHDVAALARQACDTKQPASFVYGQGRCPLAANRDYEDDQRQQHVCGFDPEGSADDTLVVARITGPDARTLATVVNYACHPTTLAWENTVISPDYVGAMRELVESATGAPCLFLQGASGDLGPREGFVGDTAVADRNGRQLGHAAMAAIEALPPPDSDYAYAGPVVSGATLGIWKYVPAGPDRRRTAEAWQVCEFVVPLPYRQGLPDPEETRRQQARWQQEEAAARAAGDAVRARDARAMTERMTRSLLRVGHLPPGDGYPYTVQLARLGDAVWLTLSGEHYSLLQRELRRRFPLTPILVGTLANGYDVSYLLDQDSFGKGLYQEDVAVLARGSLETLIEAITAKLTSLLPPSPTTTA